VAYGSGGLDDAAMWRALEDANASEFVKDFPHGADTQVCCHASLQLEALLSFRRPLFAINGASNRSPSLQLEARFPVRPLPWVCQQPPAPKLMQPPF